MMRPLTTEEARVLALLWRLRIANDADRKRLADTLGVRLGHVQGAERWLAEAAPDIFAGAA